MKQIALFTFSCFLFAAGASAQTAPVPKVLPDGDWVLEEVNDLEGYGVTFTNRNTGLPPGIPELHVSGTSVDLVTTDKTWKGSWTIRQDSLYIEPGEGMPARSFGIAAIGPKEIRLRILQKEILELIYRRKQPATPPKQ
ncbi:MAG: hypothetical protein EOO15_23640 [Chitinophagaceae bacterium]|nr:MAG: hypothetical protein EOO15_23640 [Chitinophagaceae bacterium]